MDPSFSSDAFVPDRLIAGDLKLVTREVTLTDNQGVGALSRGTILSTNGTEYAIVHQTGAFAPAASRAILAKDADPSGGDVTALVYEMGEFNVNELVTGGTVTIADVENALRALGIFIKDPVSAV